MTAGIDAVEGDGSSCRHPETALEMSQPDLEHETLPQKPRIVLDAAQVFPEAPFHLRHP
jgi:hypothetical protein